MKPNHTTDSDRIADLERRVAELENNAKLVNHPTWLIPTSQSIPSRHWTDTTTPIRTDEVTCTGEMK